eukprot:6791270-Pyramimonas_sp.AAC.1
MQNKGAERRKRRGVAKSVRACVRAWTSQRESTSTSGTTEVHTCVISKQQDIEQLRVVLPRLRDSQADRLACVASRVEGESGGRKREQLDKAVREKGKGSDGCCACILAVIGTGGPVKGSNLFVPTTDQSDAAPA